MNLKFEIENNLLIYKKPKNNLHTDSDGLLSTFMFTTPEWKHIDKYVIFWNKKGKSFIRYLGKGIKEQCPTPKEILNDLYFHVQIYANDDLKTQKLKVFVYDKTPVYRPEDDKNTLCDYIEKVNNKIDNIYYKDGKILIYVEKKLMKCIDLVDEVLVAKIMTQIAPNYIIDKVLSPDSEHPLSNKVIYNALLEKVNMDALAPIAFSGDYNDLINIPESFPPQSHTHESSDITNLDDDFNNFIDELIERL